MENIENQEIAEDIEKARRRKRIDFAILIVAAITVFCAAGTLTFITDFTVIIAGILLGGIYGLAATSVSLALGVMRAVNWAYGVLLVIFMYATYAYWRVGIDPLVSILLHIPLAIFLGYVVQVYVVEKLVHPWRQLMGTLGFSVALYGVIVVLFGPDFKGIYTDYSYSVVQFGDTLIQVTRLILGVVGISGLLVLHLLVTRTNFGLGVRATAQNPIMAEIVGIDVRRIYLVVSIVSMMCLALSGPLLLMTFSMYPDSGGYWITLAFLITLIGQPGSLAGTLAGGMIVALSETFVAWYWGAWANGFTIYILFIVVLLIRPLKMRLGY